MSFVHRLAKRIDYLGSHLCVGLDPRPDLIQGDLWDFLRQVIDETAGVAAAYKPNIAYFEALGLPGHRLLEQAIARARDYAPVILDAKRGDIAETMACYARACFDLWGADAVTLNPYLGYDSLAPFLACEGKGLYLLAITSNPGAADLQALTTDQGPVYARVGDFARRAAGSPAAVGLVAGLTNLDEAAVASLPDVPLLIPGLGAQGGDPARLRALRRTAPLLVNASRAILYGPESTTFAQRAQTARDAIEAALHA